MQYSISIYVREFSNRQQCNWYYGLFDEQSKMLLLTGFFMSNPIFIIDTNAKDLTTVNNRNDTEVLIIHRTPKDILCF